MHWVYRTHTLVTQWAASCAHSLQNSQQGISWEAHSRWFLWTTTFQVSAPHLVGWRWADIQQVLVTSSLILQSQFDGIRKSVCRKKERQRGEEGRALQRGTLWAQWDHKYLEMKPWNCLNETEDFHLIFIAHNKSNRAIFRDLCTFHVLFVMKSGEE